VRGEFGFLAPERGPPRASGVPTKTHSATQEGNRHTYTGGFVHTGRSLKTLRPPVAGPPFRHVGQPGRARRIRRRRKDAPHRSHRRGGDARKGKRGGPRGAEQPQARARGRRNSIFPTEAPPKVSKTSGTSSTGRAPSRARSAPASPPHTPSSRRALWSGRRAATHDRACSPHTQRHPEHDGTHMPGRALGTCDRALAVQRIGTTAGRSPSLPRPGWLHPARCLRRGNDDGGDASRGSTRHTGRRGDTVRTNEARSTKRSPTKWEQSSSSTIAGPGENPPCLSGDASPGGTQPIAVESDGVRHGRRRHSTDERRREGDPHLRGSFQHPLGSCVNAFPLVKKKGCGGCLRSAPRVRSP
jgi:hypothetical protein